MAVLHGKADKVVKTILLIWVVISGLMSVVVGIVHFVEHGWFGYQKPRGLISQGGVALTFQAIVCIIFGIFFCLLPFSQFLRKLPIIKQVTFAYNRVTLLIFYAVGGFIVFSMCGIMGLVFACFYWLSFIIVIVLMFLTSPISKMGSSSSSSSDSK